MIESDVGWRAMRYIWMIGLPVVLILLSGSTGLAQTCDLTGNWTTENGSYKMTFTQVQDQWAGGWDFHNNGSFGSFSGYTSGKALSVGDTVTGGYSEDNGKVQGLGFFDFKILDCNTINVSAGIPLYLTTHNNWSYSGKWVRASSGLESASPGTSQPQGAAIPAYTCEAPPTVTSEQIDKYLDFLGGMLQVAHEKASPVSLDPLYARRRGFEPEFTWKDAADLGRAVWDQSRGLQRAALAGDIILSSEQVQRTKAFGHWADWLEKRAERGPYAGPEPPYPLFGPINQQVPTPPQLKGEAPSDIYWEEYSWATAKTIFQGADLYYTRGLIWPIYLSVRDQSLKPVFFAGISQFKYGPALIGAYLGYVEASQYDQLTWDQHLQNIVGIYTSALATYIQANKPGLKPGTKQPTREIDLSKALFEGQGSKPMNDVVEMVSTIAKEHPEYEYTPGKSFLVARRWSEGGKDYAELTLGSTGPREARTGAGPEVQSVEVEVVKQGSQEAYYLKTDGSRIVPIGEPGYHAWKHIFERLYGGPTGFPSILEVFRGSKYGSRVEKMASEINDRTSIDLGPVNEQYKSFVEDLRSDPTYTKMSDYDSGFGTREVVYTLMIPSKCMGRKYYGRIPIADETNPGQLMNFILQDPSKPIRNPPPSDPIFRWMGMAHDHPLLTAPPMQNYVPEYVLEDNKRK